MRFWEENIILLLLSKHDRMLYDSIVIFQFWKTVNMTKVYLPSRLTVLLKWTLMPCVDFMFPVIVICTVWLYSFNFKSVKRNKFNDLKMMHGLSYFWHFYFLYFQVKRVSIQYFPRDAILWWMYNDNVFILLMCKLNFLILCTVIQNFTTYIIATDRLINIKATGSALDCVCDSWACPYILTITFKYIISSNVKDLHFFL